MGRRRDDTCRHGQAPSRRPGRQEASAGYVLDVMLERGVPPERTLFFHAIQSRFASWAFK